MPKTISDSKYKTTVEFIKAEVEPKLAKLIDNVNNYLKTKNVRIGVEFSWFIEELTEEDLKDESPKKRT